MRLPCVIIASLALLLPACATPAERISDTLASYGLERSRADCVGKRLQSDLSTAQLMELGRAARAYRAQDSNPARLSVDDLLAVSSQISDPKIPLTVARAAGRCGVVPLGFTSMAKALMS